MYEFFGRSNLPDIVESGLRDQGKVSKSTDTPASGKESPTETCKISRAVNSNTELSHLEIHRLKQREQYKNMMESLNELISVLPSSSEPQKNHTKQVVLTECTRYIQYLLVVAWSLSGDCHKIETEMLQCLAWDGFCLNDDILHLLNVFRPLSFKIGQTKHIGFKKTKSRLSASKASAKQSSCFRPILKAKRKIPFRLSVKYTPRQSRTRKHTDGKSSLKRQKHGFVSYGSSQASNFSQVQACVQTPLKCKDRLLNSAACFTMSPPLYHLPLGSQHVVEDGVKINGHSWPDSESATMWVPEFSWGNSPFDSSLVKEEYSLIQMKPYHNNLLEPMSFNQQFFYPTVETPYGSPNYPSSNSCVPCRKMYHPIRDHNYGKVRPIIAAHELTPPPLVPPMVINLDDIYSHQEISSANDVTSSQPTITDNALDFPVVNENENMFTINSSERSLRFNTGSSGCLLQAANEFPVDLSAHAFSSSSNQFVNQESRSRPQNPAFSPKMFLNILPKSKGKIS